MAELTPANTTDDHQDDCQQARQFLRAETMQTSSMLMSLPAEIRLKILRSLLRKGEALQSSGSRDSNVNWLKEGSKFAEDMQLSAQIMSCCQAMYHEAEEILYKENVLQVDLTHRTESKIDIDILGGTLDMDLGSRDISQREKTLVDMIERAAKKQATNSWRIPHYGTRDYFLRHHAAMLRFPRVDLMIDWKIVDRYDAMFNLGWILRDLLSGKVVKVYVDDGRTFHPGRLRALIFADCGSLEVFNDSEFFGRGGRLDLTWPLVTKDTFPLYKEVEERSEWQDPLFRFSSKIENLMNEFEEHVFCVEYEEAVAARDALIDAMQDIV